MWCWPLDTWPRYMCVCDVTAGYLTAVCVILSAGYLTAGCNMTAGFLAAACVCVISPLDSWPRHMWVWYNMICGRMYDLYFGFRYSGIWVIMLTFCIPYCDYDFVSVLSALHTQYIFRTDPLFFGGCVSCHAGTPSWAEVIIADVPAEMASSILPEGCQVRVCLLWFLDVC